jgi:beta-aspartyl-peptidase (threonine type)
MQFLHEPVGAAAAHVVRDLYKAGGLGGMICVDAEGNGPSVRPLIPMHALTGGAVAMPLNCSGMYRGVIRPDGTPKTAIFDDDELE